MTRSAKRPPIREVASNVVPLHPGIVVQPSKTKRTRPRRHLRTLTTQTEDLQPSTTVENSENHSISKDLHGGVSSFRERESTGLSSPHANGSRGVTAEFRRQVQKLSAMALRQRFKGEEVSHRQMMGRRAQGYVVHQEFQSFRSFLLHVGPRPAPDWTLDRTDPDDREYGPGKVRWADKTTQANNRRTTIHLDIRGEVLPLTTWARRTGQQPKTIRKRLERGRSHEAAVYGRGTASAGVSAPVADVPASYVWPGEHPEHWEKEFRAFVAFARTHAYLRTHPDRAFTRDVFTYWIAGNILSTLYADLRKRHPGYGEPNGDPDYQDPPSVQADPAYRLVEVFGPPHDRAWRRLLSHADQRHLYRNTLSRYPKVRTFPQDWGTVFRGLGELD